MSARGLIHRILFRMRQPFLIFRIYHRWRRKRLSYINENLELRSFIRAMGVRQEAVEELLRDKQEKILRLQAAIIHFNAAHHPGIRTRQHDLRPERIISSADDWLREFANDFEARQQEFERTGCYDRRDRVSTDPGPEDPGAASD